VTIDKIVEPGEMLDFDNNRISGANTLETAPNLPTNCFYANDSPHGKRELDMLYHAAESNGIPVMIHTGTSIFPGNRYGDHLYVDDVAVDFPKLKIVLARRPLWMDTAFFMVRRHPKCLPGDEQRSLFPPAHIFPRLAEIADKTLLGTDWPGPGVRSLKAALDSFQALPLAKETQQRILTDAALTIWPTAEPVRAT
jgi:predicted TIM-barrel fold metal-dependent hydrolase